MRVNERIKKALSLLMAVFMVLGMVPMTSLSVFAISDYAYIDADGSNKSVSSATEITSSTTTWNSGWYYVGTNVTISSRITVSGDVKLILGAGYTLTASQGIHVSGGNTLTIYSQETAGTLIANGTQWSAAIGGNGKQGDAGAAIDTAVGTIVINGGNIVATGDAQGAAIGSGWGGTGGSITVNGGNVTATGGEYGAGIGTSQRATNTVNITITGGTVNATGGRGAASIGTGYGAEAGNVAIINITGGNITAGRNWATAAIGNGVQTNSATTISITGGVIDAEVIGNYTGGWTAQITDLIGAGFKQDPAAYLKEGQYSQLGKDGLYYVEWEKASAVIETASSGTLTVWINGVQATPTHTRYSDGKLYIYGLSAGNVKAVLNDTAYYGTLKSADGETKLTSTYVKATGITLEVDSISAGVPIDLANHITLTPETFTLDYTFQYEVVTESTTSTYSWNDSVLTASAGKITVKITASDGYSSCSGTFSFDVTETDNLDIAYGNIEISQNSAGNYDVSYAGFTGGKKTYGATEAIVITGTTEEYSVKVLSGTPTVVLNSCNITTWVTSDSTVSPFAISSGATAYLMLQGESTLKITSTTNGGEVAAIAVPGGAALHINGTGILNVTGKRCAGAIGGKYDALLGDITIDGGTVNADYYARNEYDVYYGTTISGSNITINGGTVTANAGMYGSAIGSGYLSEHSTTVTINGGVVNASAVFHNYRQGVAIGNAYNAQSNCSVTINGGTVTALSECEGAAIGSARTDNANVRTSVIINGGTVTAEGILGAGIGGAGNDKKSVCTVTINGGTVTATGNEGAGIGGGWFGGGATVTINGGTVTATGDEGAGIGGGESSDGAAVTINGGTVTATGNEGAGIGGGYTGNGGTVTITGGNIKATATDSNAIGSGKTASGECVLSDGKGNTVSLNTITLAGAAANTEVSAIKGVAYGLKDVETLETNKLYFYLPSGTAATAITAGGNEYFCASSDLTYYTAHDWSNLDGVCARCSTTCEHENQTGITCEICGTTLHTHQWSYALDGADTIKVTCTAENCYNINGGSVTIVAPSDLVYNGSSKDATLTYQDWQLDEEANPHITYSGESDRTNVTGNDIIASITLDGAEAKVTYQVGAISISGAVVTVDPNVDLTYTGSAITPSVTVTLNGETLVQGTVYTVSYSDNTNAGTATVTITAKGNFTGTVTKSFEIKAAEFKNVLAGMERELTYTGQAQKPPFYAQFDVVNEQPVTITFAMEENGEYGEMPSFTDAGAYEVFIKFSAPNHEDHRIRLTMRIKPAENSWVTEPAINGWTYGETASAPTAEAKFGTCYVRYTGTADDGSAWNSAEAPIKPGTYTATFSIEKTTNYSGLEETVEFTISKAASTYTAPTAKELTYTGEAQALVDAGTTADGKLVYSLSEDGEYTETIPTGKNAGAYTVWYYIVGDANHTDSEKAAVKVEIAKAALTITSGNSTITYGDAPTARGVIGSGFVNGESFADLDGRMTLSIDYEQYGDVGIYTITHGGWTSENYEITYVSGTMTVNPKPITVKADAVSKIYGETDPALTYQVEGLVNGDQMSGELKRVEGENVGTYAIEQNTLTAGNNYIITYTGAELTVNKRAVTVTAKDQTIVYGTEISATEYTADGLVEGHTATATLTPGTANVTAGGSITVSAAVITADGADVTANYEITYTDGKLVIQPDTSKIDGLTTENVTSANEADIEAVQEMLKNADSIAEEWNTISETCKELMARIEEVRAENARIEAAVSAYDVETVKSSDEEAITQLISDIDAQLATGNLTDEERATLEELKTKCNELLAKIAEVADLIAQLDKMVDDMDAETVKSTDKEALEQVIEDAQKLIDGGNVTEAEKETLKKIQEEAQALIQVIDDIAAAIKEAAEKAESYDEDSVNSADKAELKKLAEDIEALLDTENLTEEERAALEKLLEQVKEMISIIDKTAAAIKAAKDLIDARDPETVTSEDKDELERAIDIIEGLLNGNHLTYNERNGLADAKAEAEEMLDAIETAQKATETENTGKVEEVTSENVKPEDKEALEAAKEDLEKALEENGSNYTEEEKQAIQAQIQRIEEAIKALENVETVVDGIAQLPETVEPDDEATAEKILASKAAYEALTDHEKSLVDETVKSKLDQLLASLSAYDIIEGDEGQWTKGSGEGLGFVANGPLSKFVGIVVDEIELDKASFETKSGSTVITLIDAYLESLTVGEHTITVVYTDGETSGTFTVLPKAAPICNILLWIIVIVCLAVVVIVLVVIKKRRSVK